MDFRKELLLASAARLYSMGVDLEAARERLRELVKQGAAYDGREMRRACQECEELKRQWDALERQHLALQEEIMRDRQARE